MPGAAVNDVARALEVVHVAHAAVGVQHGQVGGGVDGRQPAEEAVVRAGRVLLGRPVLGAVVGVHHHQLPAVEAGAQHEGDVLHPADDRPRLWRHLGVEVEVGVGEEGVEVAENIRVLSHALKQRV